MAEQKRQERGVKVDRRVAEKLHLRFEIGAAKALLALDAKNVAALEMLGTAFTRSGRHDEALDVDLKITELSPKCAHAFYNLACSYSNLGHVDEGLGALQQALKLGYRDFNYMMTDEDLENVRRDPRFRRMLDRRWGKRQRD